MSNTKQIEPTIYLILPASDYPDEVFDFSAARYLHSREEALEHIRSKAKTLQCDSLRVIVSENDICLQDIADEDNTPLLVARKIKLLEQ